MTAKIKLNAVDLVAQLTARQREVLILIGQDLRNKEMADRLGISVKTIEKFRNQICDRTGANTSVLQAHLAIAAGLVENVYER